MLSNSLSLFQALRFRPVQKLLAEDKQKQRPVVPQCESRRHPAGNVVPDVDQFIPRLIAGDFKRGDPITELPLELLFWAEHDFSNSGMQAVRADDQIEFAGPNRPPR